MNVQVPCVEVRLSTPGRPRVILYSVRVLSNILQVDKHTVVMWELRRQIPPPIFQGPSPLNRKIRFRWYTADEVYVYLHSLGRYPGRGNRARFGRLVHSEMKTLREKFSLGKIEPTYKIDIEHIAKVKRAYGAVAFDKSPVEFMLERELIKIRKKLENSDDLSDKARARLIARTNAIEDLGWQWLLGAKQEGSSRPTKGGFLDDSSD